MAVRRVFSKRVRHQEAGVNIAADVNAVVAGGDSDGSTSVVSLSSSSRVVQRSGRTRPTKSQSRKGKEQE